MPVIQLVEGIPYVGDDPEEFAKLVRAVGGREAFLAQQGADPEHAAKEGAHTLVVRISKEAKKSN